MKIFGINDAAHYCGSFTVEAGDADGPLKDFRNSKLTHRLILQEGTLLFNQYRSCSLRDVERCLYLAASNYRRCLDLMTPSASSWAYVTAYYGTWYAAQALLGMFGCTIFDNFIVDVNKSLSGQQELIVRKIGNGVGDESTTYVNQSSHKRFWDFFYRAVTPLRPVVVSPYLVVALMPVNGNAIWQTQRRNDVNYDTFKAIKLDRDFHAAFSGASFPTSLPGILNTQYGIFEAMIELSFLYAKQFNLQTDALPGVGGTFRKKVRNLIYGARLPRIISKTKKSILLKE
jgi:hypothetical protein